MSTEQQEEQQASGSAEQRVQEDDNDNNDDGTEGQSHGNAVPPQRLPLVFDYPDDLPPEMHQSSRFTVLLSIFGIGGSTRHAVVTGDRSSSTPNENKNNAFELPRAHLELAECAARHGVDSWHTRVLRFINSSPFQHALMALLLLDVVILFVEMYLASHYPPCWIIERDGISCCSNNNNDNRLLQEQQQEQHICPYPFVKNEESAVVCDEHKYEAVHNADKVLFVLTLTILGIFQIELLALILILGPRRFLSNALYVLDLVIVASSLALEITFHALGEEDLSNLSGILVLSRVWRFVRIGHGLITTTMEHEREETQDWIRYVRECESELNAHGIALPEKKHDTNNSSE